MFTRLHHVGLVVRRLEDGLALWRDTFGLEVSAQATVEDQGVRAALPPRSAEARSSCSSP
jgi:catechol 2,3-dioxygenase-like lactoylglutathione lyase family enzyme